MMSVSESKGVSFPLNFRGVYGFAPSHAVGEVLPYPVGWERRIAPRELSGERPVRCQFVAQEGSLKTASRDSGKYL
jgi:hypothetical protein